MCYDYVSDYVPPPPQILVALEDDSVAQSLSEYVKENVTVASPDFNTAAMSPERFDFCLLAGGFCDTVRVRRFYHDHVVPSMKKTGTTKWV